MVQLAPAPAMDEITFRSNTVLSDVHLYTPNHRHLMVRLNGVGQPVFLSQFKLLWSRDSQTELGAESGDHSDVHAQGTPPGSGCTDEGSSLSPGAGTTSREGAGAQLDEDGDLDVERRPRATSDPDPAEPPRDKVHPVVLAQEEDDGPGDEARDGSALGVIRIGPAHSARTLFWACVVPCLLPGVPAPSPCLNTFLMVVQGPAKPSPPPGSLAALTRSPAVFVLLSGTRPHMAVCPRLVAGCPSPFSRWASLSPFPSCPEHTMATPLEDVGKQVWRGALLLADYILFRRDLFQGRTVLELGAGTGLASVVAATVARTVYCTDVGVDLLSMCQRNITLNSHLAAPGGGTVKVKELDWLKDDLCTDPEVPFSWSEEDVSDLYAHTTVLFAAEVFYDDDLTDALFKTLSRLAHRFQNACTAILAVEKRLNFTLRHLDVTCEAYDHFRASLQALQRLPDSRLRFVVEPVEASFPQLLLYERIRQLELWKIVAEPVT
ncbi:methyltransferase-like protein 22 isoform X2 [Lepus europaeus]|uniref:methyltransferase-like protein 22 isoform X2 n=1 Tax=Lepus europaeus TaxID=9983 RepID=UPI002B48BC79|nr:methyltransferase-like protein 22 isoform X2 [Lepus europaeus]